MQSARTRIERLGRRRYHRAYGVWFRGRPRVWAIFTHDLVRYRARAEMLNYLGRIGTLRDSVAISPRPLPKFVMGAYAYRYDLSDPAKLALASAESIAVLRPANKSDGVRCGVGMLSTETP